MASSQASPAVSGRPGRHRPLYERRLGDLIRAGAGLAVLAVSGVIASSGTVGTAEAAVFDAVNGLPGWLSPVMVQLQFLGVLVVGPVAAAVAFALRRWRLGLGALAATVLKLGLERVVKLVVERQRPAVTEVGAVLRGNVPHHGLSFVSGHAVLAVALAGLISPYLRGRLKLAPWVVASLVCMARVYLGAHNPLDVVGGAGLGLAIAGALNLALGVPRLGHFEPSLKPEGP
jgi:undecaprenyl-diphosphatase